MKPGRVIPIALCMAVAVLEGFDIQVMGVAMPRLAAELLFSDEQKGWLFSINNVGMVLGAVLGGWLADRAGRRPVFVVSVLMFGVFTLGVVLAKNFETLLAVRLLAGFGFGAALPNMMAIAAELSSPQRRAFTATLVFCGLPLGGGTVALLTLLLPSQVDWRTLFIIGGVLPLMLAPALRWGLPETLSIGERAGPAQDKVPLWQALFAGGRAWPTLLLWAAFLPTLLILYLLLNWLPSLAEAKGFPRGISPQATVSFNYASVIGALVLGWLVDRYGPRWPLTFSYAALIATLVALGGATDLDQFVTYAGLAGFFVLGANYALYGVAPAYYPMAMRGSGSGASVAVGRVGSVLGPLMAGFMLGGGASATSVVQNLAPVAAVAGIAVLVLSFLKMGSDPVS